MNNALKKINQNKYELTVELGKEDLQKYIIGAENRISQEIKIDGFRKGKAPKDLIKNQIGAEYILEQALDAAVQDSLARALDEQKLEAMNVSDLSIKENSAQKLLYTVQVTAFPYLELADLVAVKVKRRDVEIKPEEINIALEQVRDSRAKFNPKNSGIIEKGDRAEIDFEVTLDGLPIEGGVSKNHPLIVGDNRFVPGFEDQLVGMRINDEKKFSLTAPKDYAQKMIAGKKLDFVIKANNVQVTAKPVLNDEFARELGKFDSLEDLKDNIAKGLAEEKRIKEKQRLRLEILAKIAEKSKIDIPVDMIADKINDMVAEFDNDLHLKGMELSFYLTHLGKTEDDLRKDWRPEAERQISYSLILRKIAKNRNLYPSNEEIEEEVNRKVQSIVLREQVDPGKIDLEKARDAVTGELINESVFNYLENTCVV